MVEKKTFFGHGGTKKSLFRGRAEQKKVLDFRAEKVPQKSFGFSGRKVQIALHRSVDFGRKSRFSAKMRQNVIFLARERNEINFSLFARN